MGLFEEAGIILKSGEEIVKRAICKGKVPKGAFMGLKVDSRLIIVGKRGRIRKEVVPFLDFDLKNVIAHVTISFFQYEQFNLSRQY